jgi:hypothetical protein
MHTSPRKKTAQEAFFEGKTVKHKISGKSMSQKWSGGRKEWRTG